MKSGVILPQAFQVRIEALKSLEEAFSVRSRNSHVLRENADKLDSISAECDFQGAAISYTALGSLLRIIAMLVEWRSAILDATTDADRFLRSAKAQYSLWVSEFQNSKVPVEFLVNSKAISTIEEISAVELICRSIAAIALPVPYFKADERARLIKERNADADQSSAQVELAVAFISFEINDVPAQETHFLRPREAHDLILEVRVSRWPEGATSLTLSPISIESKDSYDFPKFEFDRPVGEPPFIIKKRGRAILNAPQNLQARPFEFKYTAEFKPLFSEQPVAIVGMRTLRIESLDMSSAPLTGYQAMDEKLLGIRESLRAHAGLNGDDLQSTLILLVALAGLACRALQDDLYSGAWSEAKFQKDVRSELRRVPEIASELEEHPGAAGGITDLSFRGIRIELKVDNKKQVTSETCDRFLAQTATYAVATGKLLGILCVLDCSVKSTYPNPADEGLLIKELGTSNGLIHIPTVIIRGNLPTPSDLSR